jgi:uncharacterized membrane protein YkvA (DUF1232 family)
MKDYSISYSETGFWSKIKSVGKRIPFAREVVAMFYCLADPDTPVWVKALIVAALGYFIAPVDAIPDILPFIGFTDDAAVITTTFVGIKKNITAEHFRKAAEFLA